MSQRWCARPGSISRSTRNRGGRMRALFAPGIALMHRLHNAQKLPLLSLVFTLPLGILLYETHAGISTTVAAWIGATWLLAIYCMASFYFQADSGWAYFIGVIKRVAGGDLTAVLNVRLGGYFGVLPPPLQAVNPNLAQLVAQSPPTPTPV